VTKATKLAGIVLSDAGDVGLCDLIVAPYDFAGVAVVRLKIAGRVDGPDVAVEVSREQLLRALGMVTA